jgi:hypothetical protein
VVAGGFLQTLRQPIGWFGNFVHAHEFQERRRVMLVAHAQQCLVIRIGRYQFLNVKSSQVQFAQFEHEQCGVEQLFRSLRLLNQWRLGRWGVLRGDRRIISPNQGTMRETNGASQNQRGCPAFDVSETWSEVRTSFDAWSRRRRIHQPTPFDSI